MKNLKIEIRGTVSLNKSKTTSEKCNVVLKSLNHNKIVKEVAVTVGREFHIEVSNEVAYFVYADFKKHRSRVFNIPKSQSTVFLSFHIDN